MAISIYKQDGIKALFKGLVPRTVALGMGSTVFWFLYANFQSIYTSVITHQYK
jgi:hypothetical protein